MTEEDFIIKEKKILDGIETKGLNARTSGLLLGVPAEGALVGYLVYLKQCEEMNAQIGAFSHEVSKSLAGRAIIYGGGSSDPGLDNIHQTIADYNVHNTEEGEQFIPDRRVLEKLTEAASIVFSEMGEVPYTKFSKYINSADSVILRSESGDGNYALVESIAEQSNAVGLDVRRAGGRHITVNRFTEDISPSEIGEFINLIDSGTFPGNLSSNSSHSPISLGVGYYVLDKSGFRLFPEKTFEFK